MPSMKPSTDGPARSRALCDQWVAHHGASPNGAQSGVGSVVNSEPLTFHEPRDSCFSEKQHPIIEVMQQVIQGEAVDAEHCMQSVETYTRDWEGKQGQPVSPAF